MRRRSGTTAAPPPASRVRCAVYTRKSTEEGLEKEFNSLDAQRESAEAFIRSRKAEGWHCVPDRYDDGGFSGGTVERPALQRLLADIEAGRIDTVVTYKIDRLSRSLLDFARLMEVFDRHGTGLVSVTQSFSTKDSMGRLTLNILLSFAQFEREIIGERIRDKIGAARRKGKWTGGVPTLGYDVDRSGPSPRLMVNIDEAARVRAIFDLYLELGSLLPVVQELAHRGWVNKSRITRRGVMAGGRPFDRATLHALLTNPLVTGRIVHRGEEHAGEHEAIVSESTFRRVADQLRRNARRRGSMSSAVAHGLLRGLLRCRACDCAMTPILSGRGVRRYAYYVCSRANKGGRSTCPRPSLPASEIDRLVVEELAAIAGRPAMVRAIAAACAKESPAPTTSRIRGALAEFPALWAELSFEERRRATELLVARVDFDGATDQVHITLHDLGDEEVDASRPEDAP